jgi:hypothetical protein
MSAPVISLNNSPAMCGVVPLPADAILTLPGFALVYAISSGIVLTDTDGLTTTTRPTRIMPATGAISRMKLKLSFS